MRDTIIRLAILLVVALYAGSAHADSKAEARRYFTRGMAFIESGDYRKGIEQLERAYEIRPHPSVLFNIGRAYASMGSVSKAIEYFERYEATNPPDAARVRSTLEELRLRRNLRRLVDDGMRAIRQKRYLEGIAFLNRAYEQRPHANILFNIGRAYEDAGDGRRAIATYRRYLESNPRDAKRVKTRLAKLEAKRAAARRAAATARRAPPPPPPPRRKRRRKDPPPPPPSGAKVAPSGPAKLDPEQLELLATAIIERMKDEGAFDRPELAPTVAPETIDPPTTTAIETQIPVGATASVALGGADVALEAKGGEAYEEVVVTASRRAQSPLDAPNAVTILTDEDVRLSGARTIPDLLRRVPGMDVMSMSYSDYNVAVRGFNRRIANKILVLVDGRTAYQDFLGATLWKGLPVTLNDIERIEVVRGPGSAIYGAYAYTGIINIITKRPKDINASTIELGAGNGKRVVGQYQYGATSGPVSVRASASYERADKYDLEFDPERPDFTSAETDPTRSFDMALVDLESEYRISDNASRVYLGGSARTGFHELYAVASLRNQAISGEEYNLRTGYDSDLLSIKAFWNRLRVESAPQFYRTGTDDLGSKVRFDLVSIEPVFRPEFELLGRHALVLGGEYRHKFVDWDYLDDKQNEDHFALFFQDSWSLTKQLSTIISARLDLHPLIGPLASPRLAFIYKPTPNQAIRLSAGTAFRQPTMAETYLNLSASTPTPGVAITLVGGQSELDPERIVTVDAGYRYQSQFGEFEGVAYLNRVTNLISRTPLAPTGPDEQFRPDIGAFVAGRSFYINDPRAFLAVGGELSTRLYPIDGVDVGANYALQVIFDEDTGDRFTDSPVHKFTVWGQLRTSFGLDVGLSGHFVSAQEWVEPSYDPADPTGFNTDPLAVDASFLVIGRLGYRLFDDQMEIAVSGTNLVDFGDLRHREHPFANRLQARVLATVTARF